MRYRLWLFFATALSLFLMLPGAVVARADALDPLRVTNPCQPITFERPPNPALESAPHNGANSFPNQGASAISPDDLTQWNLEQRLLEASKNWIADGAPDDLNDDIYQALDDYLGRAPEAAYAPEDFANINWTEEEEEASRQVAIDATPAAERDEQAAIALFNDFLAQREDVLCSGAKPPRSEGPAPRPPKGTNKPPRTAPAYKPFIGGNFRYNLQVRTKQTPPSSVEAHHMLPQTYREYFRGRGVNIDDPIWGAWWEKSAHVANWSKWNQAWNKFRIQYPNASVTQIKMRAYVLAKEFGIKWRPGRFG